MSSVYKLRIHKWAARSGMNLLTIQLAHEAAASAERIYQLVLMLRKGTLDERLPGRPSPEQWLSFYGDHRALTAAVGDALPEFMGSGAAVQSSMDVTRMLSRWVKANPNEFETVLREEIGLPRLSRLWRFGIHRSRRDYKKHLEEMRDELQGKERFTDEQTDRFGLDIERSPALLFYFRVALPCMFVHRTWPISLLRRARRGHPEDIENLIRLDEQAIYDPAIERWLHAEAGSVRMDRQRLLRLWREKGLNDGQFSIMQVKQSLAGLVAAMAEKFGGVLSWTQRKRIPPTVTAEQLRDLFHAVAQDKAGVRQGAFDTDIADIQSESWSKRVHEHKKKWLLVFDGPKGGCGSGDKGAAEDGTGTGGGQKSG